MKAQTLKVFTSTLSALFLVLWFATASTPLQAQDSPNTLTISLGKYEAGQSPEIVAFLDPNNQNLLVDIFDPPSKDLSLPEAEDLPSQIRELTSKMIGKNKLRLTVAISKENLNDVKWKIDGSSIAIEFSEASENKKSLEKVVAVEEPPLEEVPEVESVATEKDPVDGEAAEVVVTEIKELDLAETKITAADKATAKAVSAEGTSADFLQLKGIELSWNEAQLHSQITLAVSDKGEFSLNQDSPTQFNIKLPKYKVSEPRLLLPYFVPENFNFLNALRISQAEDHLLIEILVEANSEIFPYFSKDSELVLIVRARA